MEEDFAAVHRIDSAPLPVASKPSTASIPQAGPSTGPSKLEPFLLLAKSARGAGAASLIDQATAAQGVFAFAELLECKSIAELEVNEQHRSKWILLNIFAYGSLRDYRANASSFPSLSALQLVKLKQLTLLDLAGQKRALPYAILQSALDISSVRELEEFIIDCIYSDLIKGRINQLKQVIEVESVVGRDVRTTMTRQGVGFGSRSKDVAGMVEILHQWHGSVTDTLYQLDHFIAELRQKDVNSAATAASVNAHVVSLVADIASKSKNAPSNGGFGLQGHRNAMMVDEDGDFEDRGGKKTSPNKAPRKRTRQ